MEKTRLTSREENKRSKKKAKEGGRVGVMIVGGTMT